MPIAKIIKKKKTSLIKKEVLLFQKNDGWVIIDPETNAELISYISNEFLRREIKEGRIIVNNLIKI